MIEFLNGLTQLHNLFYSVLWFVVILTVLVFVHEFGHYIIARWNQVRVEVFSIGFGPELFGWWDRAGTRWKFSTIPLGGYVKMFAARCCCPACTWRCARAHPARSPE